jgi:hypothetical protein|tara:strand:+ start:1364 stop:1693 length:330 start_codon:yes stop_codon:yes gene_type:complete
MADKAPWRQEIELLQNYQKHATFTHTTTGSTVEDALTLAGKMEEGNKVSFVVETGGAYIAFDEDATTSTGMLVPADEGYFDDNIYISTKISIIRSSGTNARIRGIIWGR